MKRPTATATFLAAMIAGCATAGDSQGPSEVSAIRWWEQDVPATCKTLNSGNGNAKPFPHPGHVRDRELGRGGSPSRPGWVDRILVPELASDWLINCPVRLNIHPVHEDGHACTPTDVLKLDHQLRIRDVDGVRRAAVYDTNGALFDLAMTPVFVDGSVVWLTSEESPNWTVVVLLKKPAHNALALKYYEVELFSRTDASCRVYMPDPKRLCEGACPRTGDIKSEAQTESGGGYEPPD